MPPYIREDSIQPVRAKDASVVIQNPEQAAIQDDPETPKAFFAKGVTFGSETGVGLGEILPRPQPFQDDLEVASPSRSKLRITAVMTALFATTFIAALNQTIVATAIPTISADLQSASGYAWIGGAYLLAGTAASLVWGRLSDIWGRKPILLAAVGSYFLTSIICATSSSMKTLIVGRACQGAVGGGLNQLVNITIADMFSLRARSFYMGLYSIIWAVAGAVGPILGGVFTQYLSWRFIFWINLPICGTAFLLLLFFLDVHNPRTSLVSGMKAVDWFGTISVLGLMVMLLLGLDFGGATFPWNSPTVIGLIVAGGCMSGFFLWSEKSLAKYPIMPLGLFTEKSNTACLLVAFFQDFVYIATEYYLPLFFQSCLLASPLRSGTLLVPVIVTEAVTGIVCGIYIHRTGSYLPLIWIGTSLLAIGSSLYTMLNETTKMSSLIAFQIVAGLGMGLLFTPPLLGLQAHVSQKDTATATSTMGFVRNLSKCLSVVIGGVTFQNSMAGRSHEFLEAGLSRNLTMALTGENAAASVNLVGGVTDLRQQMVVRKAYAASLKYIWIVCACMAGATVLCGIMVSGKVLSEVHVETRTGVKDLKRPEEVVPVE